MASFLRYSNIPHAWMCFLIVVLSIGLWMAAESSAFGARYESAKYGIGIEMPPEYMQREIVRQMKAGIAPKFKAVSMDDIKWASGRAGVQYELWGCHCESPIVVLTFHVEVLIWDKLEGADRHFVLVHEYAHKIFGWKDP